MDQTPTRLFELTAPLGDSGLLFHRMTVMEELSRLSEFHLEMLSERNSIDPNTLLGQRVSIRAELPNGETRYFTGYITRLSQSRTHGRYHCYRTVVKPWLWFLTRTSDCRIFQSKTVPEIIREVLEENPLADYKVELIDSYRQREYCVQYRETDFNFLSRLMEEEGIYYYFRHGERNNTLVLADSYSAHSSFAGYERLPFIPPERLLRAEQEHVDSWDFEREIQPGRYVLDDYDFQKPGVDLAVNSRMPRSHEQSDYEIFDYPGEYQTTADGDHYVRTRIEQLHAQYELAHGTTDARGLAVGYLFKLTNHPRADQNREYLIVAASHNLKAAEYESMDESAAIYSCQFTALNSRQTFRPKPLTPRPTVAGPQTAIVVGPAGDEIHTDKFGRVKVQFHWDRYGKHDENSSCWIRVSHPWAGKGWGAVSIPRISQEVVVNFLEGDPDQPIITGRVYNAETMPPYSLPDGAVVSGIKSSTHKGKGFNEMSMDDTAGKEKITVHGQYDMNTTVEHDQTSTIKNDKTNTVNNKFTETIKSDTSIKISEGKYTHDVAANTADYHVKGALTETYEATQATTVTGDITIKSTGGAFTVSSDSQHVYIHAATSIQLHTGASKLWMASDGNISLEGVNVTISGSAGVFVKGGVVHSEAQSEHQTKGAIVLSEGSATNTVKGGMVMLNP